MNLKKSEWLKVDNDNVDFRNGEAGTKIQIRLGEDNGLLQCKYKCQVGGTDQRS